jgi:hypothetical protein
MELSSNSRVPDGLLAAMTLLSEKPHQGVPSWESAPHPGIDERNCTALLGLRFRSSEIVSGTVVAPSNPQATNNTPTALSCLGNTVFSKVGAQTLLDGLGVIPGEGNALAAVQLTAGIVSGGIAASNQDATGAGLSLGGLIPTAASNSGVRLVVKGFSVIPLLGNAVSLVATANDVFGENGAVSTFKNCINGTHP